MKEDYNRFSPIQVLPENQVSEDAIRVFISYSWDSEEHKDKVYHLAQALRDDGIDCIIDQFVQSPDNWDRWMLDQIDESDFVLIICTERYYQRYRGKEEVNKGLGVTWESTLILGRIYNAQGRNTKFYSIFLDTPNRDIIPDGIRTTFYDLSGHDLLNLDNDRNRLIEDRGYKDLYRLLTKQPAIIPRKLGSLKKLETVDREIEQRTKQERLQREHQVQDAHSTAYPNWQCSHTLKHSDAVLSVAISHDGQIIASAGEDGIIRTWNAKNGEQISKFTGHLDAIYSVVISSDSQIIASGSGDGTIKVWALNNGELLKTLTDHSGSLIYSLSMSFNNQVLASGGKDEKIKIWDIPSGQCTKSSEGQGHSSWIRSVAFSPDAKFLASGGDDHKIIIWDPITAKPQHILLGHSDWVRSVAISSDSQTLVSGGNDSKIQIWKFPEGEKLGEITKYISGAIHAVAVSSNKQFIVGGGRDKRMKIWSLNTGNSPVFFEEHSDEINSISISLNDRTIISGSSDKTVRVWEMNS